MLSLIEKVCSQVGSDEKMLTMKIQPLTCSHRHDHFLPSKRFSQPRNAQQRMCCCNDCLLHSMKNNGLDHQSFECKICNGCSNNVAFTSKKCLHCRSDDEKPHIHEEEYKNHSNCRLEALSAINNNHNSATSHYVCFTTCPKKCSFIYISIYF